MKTGETVLVKTPDDATRAKGFIESLAEGVQLGPILIWQDESGRAKISTDRILDRVPASWAFVAMNARRDKLFLGSEMAPLVGALGGDTHHELANQIFQWSEANHLEINRMVACDGGDFITLWKKGNLQQFMSEGYGQTGVSPESLTDCQSRAETSPGLW